ncbi:hypothetical protein DES53_112173 [Roseimicrobium gellanilyticum]|uniref:Aminoglycoside phosphotransferase domain-containing protein n=1 Tax=Roseimicrobium gellanilyticum TaxID=748857 RepID=A0A366H805_9BACT|nr:bifunctional aminoglycoside phosphotransferase/ATP-binding protein [Roseimicrobium gellanilyticum]RBP38175.1 hypothetical protein DES53_112173 [Roseimicrobium gellanilyticum]
MPDANTQRLLDFMLDAHSYKHGPSDVSMVETHASWVFLAPPFAYKVKKPVNYGFLDFSTLDLRHADCERELVLNRRLAPEIYLQAEAIHESADALHFGGGGRVFEWVVKMKLMDSRFFLNNLIREQEVGILEIDRVIELLRSFYAKSSPLDSLTARSAGVRTRKSVHDNFEILRPFRNAPLSSHALDAIECFTTEFERQHDSLFKARVEGGWFRDCHGDLRLEHVYLAPEGVSIYDCIEFNEAFRHIDVASDLAFLAMDLDFNGRSDLSAHLIQQFIQTWGDVQMMSLLDYYKCYRACVRAKVACLRSDSATLTPQKKKVSLDLAQQYLVLSLRYALAGSKPQVFVFMGKVASGKSSLAERLGQETGWKVLSSDVVRKTQAGVPLDYRGTAAERSRLYDPVATSSTYGALCRQAIETLESGRNVILDATFSKREHRTILSEQLREAGHQLAWIEVVAPKELALERLRKRETKAGVVSDARTEDFEALTQSFEQPDELPPSIRTTISADDAPDANYGMLLRRLAMRHACDGVFLKGT